MRVQRGTSIIESMIGLLLSLILVSSIFFVLSATYGSQYNIGTVNAAVANAQGQIDTIADHIRNAQENASDGNRVIANAQDDEITYYASDGSTVRYYLTGGELHRATSGGTDVVVMRNISSLNLTYHLMLKYNQDYTSAPVDPTLLTDAERGAVGVVTLTCTATVENISRQFQTSIRLRNSPRKTSL